MGAWEHSTQISDWPISILYLMVQCKQPKNDYLSKTALTHRLLNVKLMTGPLPSKSILGVILLELARLQLNLQFLYACVCYKHYSLPVSPKTLLHPIMSCQSIKKQKKESFTLLRSRRYTKLPFQENYHEFLFCPYVFP